MRTRFAPSPTGYLHLGHIVAAKAAFEFGPCLLRIEDIDHTRCKPEYTTAIYKDLHWLGFDWPLPVRVQSQHLEDYKTVIEAFRASGVLYRCFKSRAQLAQSPPAPISAQQEKALLSEGAPFAWRLSIEKCRPLITAPLRYMDTNQYKTVDIDTLSDIVLARKDIGMSYHIAVTHDDMTQNITHVVRGADFIEQTPYHVLIQHLMDWPTPAYHHHPLLLRDDGEKLSKRNLDTSIKSLRENSLTVAQVLDMASL